MLRQQRRGRLRKGLLKSEVVLLQTLSRLFHLVQSVKRWQFFLGVQEKNKVVVLCSRSPQNVKLGIFTS